MCLPAREWIKYQGRQLLFSDLSCFSVGLNFISFVYQHMSIYIYKQAYMMYKTGFRRKSVDLFESVSQY